MLLGHTLSQRASCGLHNIGLTKLPQVNVQISILVRSLCRNISNSGLDGVRVSVSEWDLNQAMPHAHQD